MGAKMSKCCSSYKSQPNVFKLFLNFLPNGHKSTVFWIFDISSLRFFTIFFSFSLTWDPMGAQTSKRYPPVFLPQITLEFFLTSPEFLLSGPQKSTVFDF